MASISGQADEDDADDDYSYEQKVQDLCSNKGMATNRSEAI